MNIFALDDSPRLSALWLDDVRSNKMIVESCQLLSTAMNVLDPHHGRGVYKTSYRNHPCALWVRESWGNFRWLLRYTEHLLALRKGPRHKSGHITVLAQSWRGFANPEVFPKTEQTPFVNCAANQELGLSFKWLHPTSLAYRCYLDARWQQDTIKLTWKNGEEPWWRTK